MIYYGTLYHEGLWDIREPTRIEADSPRKAVKQVTGERLDDAGTIVRLRASVRTTPDSAPIAQFVTRKP